ncbi:hypothetical protein JHK82_029340 [Glycine max]|uniref:Uncharacterized protein n=2 Tax=Glycine subgen. Soja TaxID=1462606 RepID=K7LLP1_SOYBN|nr:hypothetical protein JHK87_029251 [Glycine soja]KAG4998550.1 hypothetical protein JHK85_029989 [Glycine max]KAG5005316.1 hypothetical protein JHK86_029455 [Glycine max]KAG5128505.1 hypothetical protein JHK82_029340 [Glycine max]KAG5153110.1 hypothetical protein JHK84_029582 [Glycine max]
MRQKLGRVQLQSHCVVLFPSFTINFYAYLPKYPSSTLHHRRLRQNEHPYSPP